MLPGDVALLSFPFANPPKPKFCLCAAPGLFLVIGSEPYRFAPADSQLRVFKEELAPLRHDSWIDVSKAYRLTAPEGIQTWPLAPSALGRIRHALASQPYIPEVLRQGILSALPH